MKYLVIGLGNLGRAIAKDLTRVGNEVIGVDMDLHRVDMLKNDIAGAVALDSTDKEALSTLSPRKRISLRCTPPKRL